MELKALLLGHLLTSLVAAQSSIIISEVVDCYAAPYTICPAPYTTNCCPSQYPCLHGTCYPPQSGGIASMTIYPHSSSYPTSSVESVIVVSSELVNCDAAPYTYCPFPYTNNCCTQGDQCISGVCITATITGNTQYTSSYVAVSSTITPVPLPSPSSSSSPPPQPPSESSGGGNPGNQPSPVPQPSSQPSSQSSSAPPTPPGGSSAPASHGMDLWLTAFLATGLTVGAAMVFL